MIRHKMLRKEQFAFGAGLITSALAFILSKTLAWFVLVIGFGFVVDSYIRDFVWGLDRPTKKEIAAMPAEEYRKRVLRNPKTRRWVEWLVAGQAAFKKLMRKLAREMVIFALLTSPISFLIALWVLYRESYPPGSITPWEMAKFGGHVVQSIGARPLPSRFDLALSASWFALYGLFIGVGLWILYRLVRFAVKG